MATVIQQQDEIQVAVNDDGAVVISQLVTDTDGMEVAECVIVRPIHVDALIRALSAAKRTAQRPRG